MTKLEQPIAELSRPNPFAALFEEIADNARRILHSSPYIELREISCDFSGGILTLRGRVPSYHLKQLAQTCVFGVPGVVEIRNRIEVVNPSSPRVTNWREREALALT